jgi:PNKP adenylyltransferase domain, C-terminal region
MRGRKPEQESRATEFRQRPVAWKQVPELARPSLRALTRQLGTSHQLLTFYLNGLDLWQGHEYLRIVVGDVACSSQPSKCRGPEYLRIIYGPEYLCPENLDRLRSRSVSTKRSLALREFALGIEALERLVRQEPLRRVHEGVFGVLALECKPVGPRL